MMGPNSSGSSQPMGSMPGGMGMGGPRYNMPNNPTGEEKRSWSGWCALFRVFVLFFGLGFPNNQMMGPMGGSSSRPMMPPPPQGHSYATPSGMPTNMAQPNYPLPIPQ